MEPLDKDTDVVYMPFVISIWEQIASLIQPEMPEIAGKIGDNLRDHLDPSLKPYVQHAQEEYNDEGRTEVDDNAIVSYGTDPGAYVMAWVWVDCTCPDCGETHGWCPRCGQNPLGCDEDNVPWAVCHVCDGEDRQAGL